MNIQLFLFSKEVARLGERGERGGGGTGERKAGEFGSFPISFPVFILPSYILFWSCIGSFPFKICNPFFLVFPSSFFLGGEEGVSLGEGEQCLHYLLSREIT